MYIKKQLIPPPPKEKYMTTIQHTCLCSNIFGNDFYCTELQHGQQKVWEIKYEILVLFLLLKKPSSPSTKPTTTHPFLLAIIYSYSNTITATQYLICKTVQYCVKQ